MALAATFALLLVGTSPAFGGPPEPPGCDTDGIIDSLDNCICVDNPLQEDTDGDDCGNVCDGDFDQDGIVGFSDFGQFGAAFNSFDLEKDLTLPVTGPVGFSDFGKFGAFFNSPAGPSGTTAGTLACP